MSNETDKNNRTAETLSFIDIMEGFCKNMKEDPAREKRRAEQLCRACYYDPERQIREGKRSLCVACHDRVVTDAAICWICADEQDLCKRCGADIELRDTKIIRGTL